MANYTAGPWQVKNEYTGAWEVIANPDEIEPGRYTYDSICDCDQPSKSCMESEESKANARLIACAPELLALLKIARKRLAHSVDCVNVNNSDKWGTRGSTYFAKCCCGIAEIDSIIRKAESEE